MTTEQETEPDWAAKQTDRVIDVIDKVKAQTTDRAVTVLRAVVFGVVIAVLGVAAPPSSWSPRFAWPMRTCRSAPVSVMPPGLPTSSPAACCRSSASVPGCRVVPARAAARRCDPGSGHHRRGRLLRPFQLSWSTLNIPDPS